MQLYIQIIVYASLTVFFSLYFGIVRHSKKQVFRVPMGFLILFFLLKTLVPVFNYAQIYSTAESLDVAATIVLWMAVVRIIVYFAVDYFLRLKKGLAIPTITRDFGLAIIYIIIAMIVLRHKAGVNLGSLLTTSAILTAVIGFAMQDTLGNLFSGLALQLEHPYQMGDWIGFEGIVGKVEGITWKSTKILTRSEELIFVPNNIIAKSVLTNFSRPTPSHCVSVEVGVSYDMPPHIVRSALTGVMLNHPKVLGDPAPAVRVTKFDNSSVNYKAIFYTEDVGGEERTKMELLNDIWYKFKREGIKIPYPMQEQIEIMPADIKEAAQIRVKKEADENFEILKNIDIFKGLNDAARGELAGKLRQLAFAKGEAIVRQGGESGPMYIIKEGECEVLVSTVAGGGQSKVATLAGGSVFGEMSVLTGAPRTATVRAVTDTICLEVEKKDLTEIFSSHPDSLLAVSKMLSVRSLALKGHKEKAEETAQLASAEENALMGKIKSFFGL